MAEYEAGNLEQSPVPLADMDRVKADPVLSEDLVILPDGCTYYYGFNTSLAPVDNVHMRRALSHAIDRQGLVDNVTKGGQQPAQWFCRPGMTGCPTMDKYPNTGIKSDPEAAPRAASKESSADTFLMLRASARPTTAPSVRGGPDGAPARSVRKT